MLHQSRITCSKCNRGQDWASGNQLSAVLSIKHDSVGALWDEILVQMLLYSQFPKKSYKVAISMSPILYLPPRIGGKRNLLTLVTEILKKISTSKKQPFKRWSLPHITPLLYGEPPPLGESIEGSPSLPHSVLPGEQCWGAKMSTLSATPTHTSHGLEFRLEIGWNFIESKPAQ